MSISLDKFAIKLGKNVKRLRKQRNMTQIDLSKALGVSQPLISKIEAGRTPNLSINVVLSILQKFGYTFEQLTK